MVTRRKFLSLKVEQQHKKCAELLKRLYETESVDLLEHYHEIISWMGIPFPVDLNKKAIADAYHRHLNLSCQFLKEHNLLPTVKTGDKTHALPKLDIDIYLDHIRSGHNVGSMIRTIEAFSLGDIYFSKDTPFIDNKKVLDASMGSERYVQAHKNADLNQLKRPIIALETCENAISLYDFLFPRSFTLIVGNEEYGCSDESLMLADYVLEIPLRGHKNSLNVANAFAITASEILRQQLHFS